VIEDTAVHIESSMMPQIKNQKGGKFIVASHL